MAKVAFVFPGQGSQAVGMGRALCDQFPEAKEVFEAADDALGEKLSSVCFEGPAEALSLTANTQPAILTVSVAAHAVFSRRFEAPLYLAGHSLGEYSALVAGGAMALTDAVKAVRARGTFMQEAVAAGVGAMAAVMALPPAQVAKLCEEAAKPGEVVSPANFNSPEQTVIAGHAGAVERAVGLLKAAGGKVRGLPVSAPFHCALMEPVKARLAPILERMPIRRPAHPIITNVEARPNQDPARIVPLLLSQITQPVRWMESVQWLEQAGVEKVVELGPGKVLSGLIKRTAKSIAFSNVEDPSTLQKALEGKGQGEA